MIIGISGKIGSGKDLIGKRLSFDTYCQGFTGDSSYEIKKFADKLKERISLTWSINRSLLESQEFKTQIIPELNITWRELMQLEGTKMREINEDYWVNALMCEYKPKWAPTGDSVAEEDVSLQKEYPNWIITDLRFPNEAQAIKEKGGILIRVNRLVELRFPEIWDSFQSQDDIDSWYDYLESTHKYNIIYNESETALDDYKDWDYVIHNNGTIEDLIEKIKKKLV